MSITSLAAKLNELKINPQKISSLQPIETLLDKYVLYIRISYDYEYYK